MVPASGQLSRQTRRFSHAFLAAWAVLAAACAHPLASVPAPVPAGAYAHLGVLAPPDPRAREVADALEGALRRAGLVVASRSELEAELLHAGRAGRDPTAVLNQVLNDQTAASVADQLGLPGVIVISLDPFLAFGDWVQMDLIDARTRRRVITLRKGYWPARAPAEEIGGTFAEALVSRLQPSAAKSPSP